MIISKKKIFIHAGPGKTGTSAIQSWLSENVGLLKEQGVYYPYHSVDLNGVSSGNRSSIMVIDGDERYICRNKVDHLMLEFERSGCHTLLLSSEFFYLFISDIAKIIPDAEFIVYVRHPLELIESNYNQGVKRHGKTAKFTPPENLESYLWDNLKNIAEILGVEKLHLRPYASELYYNGNVVSDTLKVIGLDLKIENKNVNPSFTLPALELKRLLNNFNFGVSEKKIDKVLQSYSVGVKHYSFITNEIFKNLNLSVCKGMQDFIEASGRFDLLPLLEVFKNKQSKAYFSQYVSDEDLNNVVLFLKKSDSVLYSKIKANIEANNNLYVDDSRIFKVFSVECCAFDMTLNDSFLLMVEGFTIHPGKRGKVLSEIGKYHLKMEDYDNAITFFKGACHFFPGNESFKKLLNNALIDSNANALKVKKAKGRRFFMLSKLLNFRKCFYLR